ncbi:hypothetical protein PLESTM_001900000 [Pleodorina starrii]|nr:hypothetical protein PLESTM_001900000 [Pleodorina starrii]
MMRPSGMHGGGTLLRHDTHAALGYDEYGGGGDGVAEGGFATAGMYGLGHLGGGSRCGAVDATATAAAAVQHHGGGRAWGYQQEEATGEAQLFDGRGGVAMSYESSGAGGGEAESGQLPGNTGAVVGAALQLSTDHKHARSPSAVRTGVSPPRQCSASASGRAVADRTASAVVPPSMRVEVRIRGATGHTDMATLYELVDGSDGGSKPCMGHGGRSRKVGGHMLTVDGAGTSTRIVTKWFCEECVTEAKGPA